jgi:hypothetical protein
MSRKVNTMKTSNQYYITARRSSGELVYYFNGKMTPNAYSLATRFASREVAENTRDILIDTWRGLSEWQVSKYFEL